MEDKTAKGKRKNLEEAGLLNPAPERVEDPLFHEHPEFFDAHDTLQVRYEMLRSHQVDRDSVVDVCKRYGVSRQTFYQLQKRFVSRGTLGLLSKKSGPRGPSKLTGDVLKFVTERVELERDVEVGTSELLQLIEGEFGISLHKRTIEKLLKELRSKKNS